MTKYYYFFMLMLLSTSIGAQITPQLFIDTSYTPEEMVMDFFSNSNIIPSNVVYTGSKDARGYFDAGTTSLPINAGIVLSTGKVITLPTTSYGSFSSAGHNISIQDPDLNTIESPFGQTDLARLEFDIIPQGDTLRFFYVFGSEEYPEYINSSFNDLFGFFIKGGPEYPNAVNIALIPNSMDPITINTVNQNENSEYFIPWYDLGGSFCDMDATTVLLEAKVAVTPGESYHAKIAIADRGDNSFDSAVFMGIQSLEGDSLLTPPTDFYFSVNEDTVFLSNQSKYALAHEWDFGDGDTSDLKEPGFHVFDSPMDTVSIQLSSYSWCCAGVMTKTFSLLDAPVPGFEASATEICQGSTIQFIDNSTGTSIQERFWEFPGGEPSTSTETNPLVFYPNPGHFDVRLSLITDLLGNTKEELSFISVVSNQITAQAGFSFNQEGPLMQFSSTSQNDLSLWWDFGNGETSTLGAPIQAFPDTGYFEVTLIAANICNTDTLTQQVYMANYVDAQFTAFPLSGCAPLTVQFANETDYTSLFHWSFPGGNPETSVALNPEVTYLQAGWYDVTFQAGTAPFSDELHFIQYIEALPSPTASFEPALAGLEVSISNLSENADQFFWDFGDGNTSTDIEPVHIYAEAGNYQIILVAENSCGTDTATFNLLISGLENANLTDQWFDIFPNPVASDLLIQPMRAGEFGLRLFDSAGNLLLFRKGLSGNVSIDMGPWPAGVYWLELKTIGHIFSRRFVKKG